MKQAHISSYHIDVSSRQNGIDPHTLRSLTLTPFLEDELILSGRGREFLERLTNIAERSRQIEVGMLPTGEVALRQLDRGSVYLAAEISAESPNMRPLHPHLGAIVFAAIATAGVGMQGMWFWGARIGAINPGTLNAEHFSAWDQQTEKNKVTAALGCMGARSASAFEPECGLGLFVPAQENHDGHFFSRG